MNADAKDLNEFKSENDLNHLRLLVDYKYSLTYSDYKAVNFFISFYLHKLRNFKHFLKGIKINEIFFFIFLV